MPDPLEEPVHAQKSKGSIARFLPLAVVGGLLATGYAMGLHEFLSLSSVIQQREALAGFISERYLVSVLSFIGLYALLVAVSFPGASFLTIASGLLFGLAGGLYALVGATLGAIAIFSIARTSLGTALQSKAGPFVNRMVEGFKKDAFQYLLFVRLTPVFPFWAVNIVPALLNMPLKSYVLATALGILPGTFVFAYVGTGLDSIIAEQQVANPGCAAAGDCAIEPGSLVTPEILIAMAGLAAISILPILIRKLRNNRAQ